MARYQIIVTNDSRGTEYSSPLLFRSEVSQWAAPLINRSLKEKKEWSDYIHLTVDQIVELLNQTEQQNYQYSYRRNRDD